VPRVTDSPDGGLRDASDGVPRETDEALDEWFGERRPLIERFALELGTSAVERGLIGPREVPRLWSRHILNCVAVAELIPTAATLADVGSGAGLPGLVLAIVRPDLDVTLIEPLLRRTVWLDEVVSSLGLPTAVFRGRAEEWRGPRFTVVTARAVAPLDKLAGWCLPLLESGGQLLALKGRTAKEELDAATPALRRLGLGEADVVLCGAHLPEPTTVVRLTRRP
jgi:16S rRNA (guanine527-N7)-methyltransferase